MLQRIRAAWSALRAPQDQVGHNYSWYTSTIDEWAEQAYDDLVQRKGVGIYREMMKRDDCVHATIRLPIIARLSKLPKFQPRTDRADDRIAAWLCEETFDRLSPGSMTRFLSDAMTAIAMGHSPIEKVWGEPFQVEVPEELATDSSDTDEQDNQPVGSTRRMVQLPRRFHLLPAETITYKLNEYGEIEDDGVWQLAQRYVTPAEMAAPGQFRRLPRDRFVLWKWLEEEGWDNPFGLSVLRPAYRWYFLKDMIVRWAGEYMERFGKPGVKVRTKDSLNPTQARAIDALLQNFQTSNRYRLSESVESMEILELKHTATDAYEQWLKLCNRSIARCGLVPSLVMEGGETVGSNALGQTHRDTFDLIVDHLGALLADEVLRDQVCGDIVRRNVGDVRPPLVQFPPLAEKDRTRIIGEMKLAQEAGYVVPRQWAYEEAGIPMPGDEEEVLDSPGSPEVGLGEEDIVTAKDPAVRDLIRDVARADGGKDKDDVIAVLQGMGRHSRYAHRDGLR